MRVEEYPSAIGSRPSRYSMYHLQALPSAKSCSVVTALHANATGNHDDRVGLDGDGKDRRQYVPVSTLGTRYLHPPVGSPKGERSFDRSIAYGTFVR